MRFDRIELTNYRSFGPGTTVVEFPAQENIVALVGANNAGKSNLLSAMRLALGSGRRDAGDPSDFHQLDITQELRITLILREPLKRENIYRKTDIIQGFYFRAHRGQRGGEKGQIKTENYCLDEAGETYRPAAAVGRRTGAPDPEAEPVRLLDELHIDAFVLTDGDASKIKNNDSTAKNVAAVETAAAGRMFRFTEDIETALGTEKRGRVRTPPTWCGSSKRSTSTSCPTTMRSRAASRRWRPSAAPPASQSPIHRQRAAESPQRLPSGA